MLRGEQERDIHGYAREDGLFDRGQPLFRSGNLDEEVVAPGLLVQRLRGLDSALRVVGEERRDLERDPAVDAVRPLVDGTEHVGRAPEVLDRELEEERLAVEPGRCLFVDRVVVATAGDRLVEDRRIRRQPGDGVVVDVRLELPGVEQLAGDVVEPEALPQLVQRFGGVHVLLLSCLGQRRRARARSVPPRRV